MAQGIRLAAIMDTQLLYMDIDPEKFDSTDEYDAFMAHAMLMDKYQLGFADRYMKDDKADNVVYLHKNRDIMEKVSHIVSHHYNAVG